MLSLDDPRWRELTQAYGSAEDVPRVLESLVAARDDHETRAALWFALWRMLHRPGEMYSASYASVPHLLAAVDGAELAERAHAAHLVTRIELARTTARAEPMPEFLVEDYAAAVERLPALVAECAQLPWDTEVAQVLLAALAVGKRQPALAEAVLAVGEAG